MTAFRRHSLRKSVDPSLFEGSDDDVFLDNDIKHTRSKSISSLKCQMANYGTKVSSTNGSRESLDGLLWDLYDRWNGPANRNGSFDSDTLTEGSSLSEAWQGKAYHNISGNGSHRLTRANLHNKGNLVTIINNNIHTNNSIIVLL